MLNSLNKKICVIVFLNLIILTCLAQDLVDDDVNIIENTYPAATTDRDSLGVQLDAVDGLEVESLHIDKPVEDTLRFENADDFVVMEQDALYDSVFYHADSIHYEFAREKIDFTGNTKLEFQGAALSADTLSLDMKAQKAVAKGKSFMEQGDHQMIGQNIYYDLETRWGRILGGASQFDLGYYYGEEIRKVDERTYDIDNGYFTTCDAEEPHFYIGANQFRMYQDDKVIAKPVVFYVNHVPVFALPFGTFSIKKGRKSGMLVPTPGYDSENGKKIEDIAFYFAYRDHFDATLFMNIYEKTGWKLGLKSEYITRYVRNGNFSAVMEKDRHSPSSATFNWNVKGRHHQDYGNKTTFDANFNFYSSKSVWEDSSDMNERLSEKITSSVAYKQPFFGNTLSITSSYTDDLKNKHKAITLPKLSYNLPSKPVYELFSSSTSQKSSSREAWWKNLSYSYGVNALHSGTINDSSATFWDVIYKTKEDSTGYINQHNAGIKHRFGLSYSDKLKGWLNIRQTLSYNEAWFDRDKDNDKLVRGFDYSTNSSSWFSLYGLREFQDGYVRAVRHVITPRVSFSYNPDFGHNDKFYSFNGIGVSKSDRSRKLSFSLKNGWDLKVAGEDEAPDKRINDLFSISSSLSYNFEAENERFSDISHDLRVKSGSVKFWLLDLSISPSGSILQDFYRFKRNSMDYSTLDFAVSDWDFQLNTTLKSAGEAPYVDYFPVIKNDFEETDFFASDSLQAEKAREDAKSVATLAEYDRLELEDKKWSFSMSHTFRTDKDSYANQAYSSKLANDINLRISKNWYVTYNNSMDLKEKDVTTQSIILVRDLHCWKIRFKYTRQADYWNYEIKLFNIELEDTLKYKTSGRGN